MLKTLLLSLSTLFVIATASATCEEISQGEKYCCSSEQSDASVEVGSLNADQGDVFFTEDMIRCLNAKRPGLNPKNTCEHSCTFTRE